MPRFLCMDTATKACSVSVLTQDGVASERTLQEDGYVHAEKLHVLIQEVITESGIRLKDMDAIVIGKGPGSYTGLRIGVSTAKGLAYGIGKPLMSIPTLQIMAACANEAIEEPGPYSLRPMLDARRMEVYSTAYDRSLKETVHCAAHLLEEDPFSAELDQGPVYFFGDGMTKAESLLSQHPNARFIHGIVPDVSKVYSLASLRYSSEQFEDVAYFEPFYLKEFVAGKPKKLV